MIAHDCLSRASRWPTGSPAGSREFPETRAFPFGSKGSKRPNFQPSRHRHRSKESSSNCDPDPRTSRVATSPSTRVNHLHAANTAAHECRTPKSITSASCTCVFCGSRSNLVSGYFKFYPGIARKIAGPMYQGITSVERLRHGWPNTSPSAQHGTHRAVLVALLTAILSLGGSFEGDFVHARSASDHRLVSRAATSPRLPGRAWRGHRVPRA